MPLWMHNGHNAFTYTYTTVACDAGLLGLRQLPLHVGKSDAIDNVAHVLSFAVHAQHQREFDVGELRGLHLRSF